LNRFACHSIKSLGKLSKFPSAYQVATKIITLSRGHPEWILPQGSIPAAPNVGNAFDLNSIFPNLVNFHLTPVPQLPLQNLLNGGMNYSE